MYEDMDISGFFKDRDIRWVDLQFTDLPGTVHHVTIPASSFTDESFEEGFAKLDGSSIRGFTSISESDMVLMPVKGTLRLIPWTPNVARVLCKVHWGGSKGRFENDPRGIAESAEKLQEGLGYKSFFGPELEFFIFDGVDVDVSNPYSGTGYKIRAREAPWGEEGGFVVRFKEGYYPAPPIDKMMDLRMEIADTLVRDFGFSVEAHHHEVATAGQAEIDFKYSTLVDAADSAQTLKYVAKNIASRRGMVATFMPKPMFGDNGSGMHVHMSVWDAAGKRNLMYDQGEPYAEISQLGRYAMGGILRHARALSAIVSPTMNSYRRLIPGFEAPVYLAWSRSNRSAVVRIPAYHKGIEGSKRIEYRAPDGSSNPYLAFSAMLCAALDGIKAKTEPGPAVEENIYNLSEVKRRDLGIKEVPKSLDEALDELENDREFLKPVFGSDILDKYIELKRGESRTISMYPHPMEMYYYLDA
ncbi:MAG: type I glutamate--ammonia ligase [Candidatus Micrarchaeota archaeon]|nr:type I glutamate--ammonia ligase [Candidatus Micrarchaeota archaeon]